MLDGKSESIKYGSTAHLAGEQTSKAVIGKANSRPSGNSTANASRDGMFASGVSGQAHADATEQDIKSTTRMIAEPNLSPSEGSLKMALVNYLQNNIREMGSRVTQPPETPEINLKDIALLKNSTKESKFGIVK